MKTTTLPLPVVALIGATRGMLGAGIALLVAEKLTPERRTRVGRILLAIGVASTIPLAATVIRNRRSPAQPQLRWRSDLGPDE